MVAAVEVVCLVVLEDSSAVDLAVRVATEAATTEAVTAVDTLAVHRVA